MKKQMAPQHRLPWSLPIDRDEFILGQCERQRVLHLACASAPFTRKLHASGQLLHDKMRERTAEIYGVDIDRQALSYLESNGFHHLIAADLLDRWDVDGISQRLPWIPDVVLAGELLEHLDQQGLALTNISRLLGPESKLVITVPNSFSIKSFLRVCVGHEKVAHDHVSYFSYVNLKELVGRAVLQVDQVAWYTSSFVSTHPLERLFDRLIWPALAIRPQLSDGIVVVCTLKTSRQRSTFSTVGATQVDSEFSTQEVS